MSHAPAPPAAPLIGFGQVRHTRLRPRRPILGLSHQRQSLQHMALEWGVTPLEMPETSDVEDLWSRSVDISRASGIVAPGDRVVITAGTAVNMPGSTNVIKVEIA